MEKILIIGASSGIGKSLYQYYQEHTVDLSVINRKDYDPGAHFSVPGEAILYLSLY